MHIARKVLLASTLCLMTTGIENSFSSNNNNPNNPSYPNNYQWQQPVSQPNSALPSNTRSYPNQNNYQWPQPVPQPNSALPSNTSAYPNNYQWQQPVPQRPSSVYSDDSSDDSSDDIQRLKNTERNSHTKLVECKESSDKTKQIPEIYQDEKDPTQLSVDKLLSFYKKNSKQTEHTLVPLKAVEHLLQEIENKKEENYFLIKNCDNAITELRNKLKSSDDMCALRTDACKTTSTALSDTKKTLVDKEQELISTQDILISKEEQIKKLEKQIDKVTTEKETLSNELEKIRTLQAQNDQIIATLKNELHSMKEERNLAKTEKANILKQYNEDLTNLPRFKKETKELKKENEKLENNTVIHPSPLTTTTPSEYSSDTSKTDSTTDEEIYSGEEDSSNTSNAGARSGNKTLYKGEMKKS